MVIQNSSKGYYDRTKIYWLGSIYRKEITQWINRQAMIKQKGTQNTETRSHISSGPNKSVLCSEALSLGRKGRGVFMSYTKLRPTFFYKSRYLHIKCYRHILFVAMFKNHDIADGNSHYLMLFYSYSTNHTVQHKQTKRLYQHRMNLMNSKVFCLWHKITKKLY